MKAWFVWLRRVAAWLLALAVPVAACAAQHALLVGVSGYPNLPEELRLNGPRNDVQRMRQVLLARGFVASEVQLLADGVPGGALPTRANILAALARLATVAQEGDTVFLHFAGHGSQQPADRNTPEGRREADGLHEIFLPLDVGRWDGKTGTVHNALVNYELRAAVDAISARGAHVFAVFDACHSATLVRGGSASVAAQDEAAAGAERIRWRHVPTQVLGIDAAAMTSALSALPAHRGAALMDAAGGALDPLAAPMVRDGQGSTAFFYAAQTTELTPELPLPLVGAARRVHGLFSFSVAQALSRMQPMSYRQLGQVLLAQYGALMQASATPLFTGNGLDRMVLGQGQLLLRQWPLEPGPPLSVAAGSLNGLEAGALLAVLPGPLAGQAESLGALQVVSAQPGRALLEPVVHAGRPAIAAGALRRGQVARLIEEPPGFALRVALAPRACASACVLVNAAAALRQRALPGVDVVWLDTAAQAELVLREVAGRILLLEPSQRDTDGRMLDDAAAVATQDGGVPLAHGEVALRLAAALQRVARARNLQRLAADAVSGPAAAGLELQLLHRVRAADRWLPAPASSALTVRANSHVMLNVDNTGSTPLDVTVLYLDAHHGVTVLFPNRLGESNRVAPGARAVVDEIEIRVPPVGLEKLLVIAVPARRLSERSDFSFLEQPALTVKRSALSEDLLAFADAAYADHRTRGEERPRVPAADVAIRLLTLRVLR